jgi:C_GCAxxG_C_C family probable redox protein
MESSLDHPAIASFLSGFNCAQSVLAEFAPKMGLTKEQACRLAAGFGGGLAHTNDICGALSGAVMAIGLKYGATEGRDRASKQRTYKAIHDLFGAFKERHGSLMCTQLLGYDMSDPGQLQEALANGAPHLTCPKYILSAIELASRAIEGAG